MSVNTKFLVPVATANCPPPKVTNGAEVLSEIGDVPHECPAKDATHAKFGDNSYWGTMLPIEWKPNWTFRVGLRFNHISVSQSNMTVSLVDPSNGKCYLIHPESFREMMTRSVWIQGLVMEDWTWEKRGRYIYLCPAYLAI